MNIPPAEVIEETIDRFNSEATPPSTAPEQAQDEARELSSAIGEDSANKLGITFPLSGEFVKGYQLGLQVARQMLAGSVALAMKNIDPATLL